MCVCVCVREREYMCLIRLAKQILEDFRSVLLMFFPFPELKCCKINSILIPAITGNAQAIAGNVIGDQDGGQGLEPPVRAGE